jgi:hypothetical protein
MGNSGSFLNASGPVEAISYDVSAGFVAAATPIGVDFFNPKSTSDEVQRSWKFFARANAVLFTPTSGFVVSGEQDGCVRVYKVFVDAGRHFNFGGNGLFFGSLPAV